MEESFLQEGLLAVSITTAMLLMQWFYNKTVYKAVFLSGVNLLFFAILLSLIIIFADLLKTENGIVNISLIIKYLVLLVASIAINRMLVSNEKDYSLTGSSIVLSLGFFALMDLLITLDLYMLK